MYIGEGKLSYTHHQLPLKAVHVFCLSDQLLITEFKDKRTKKPKFIENIPLDNATLEADKSGKKMASYDFKLSVKTANLEPTVYSFHCETQEAYQKWISDISEALSSAVHHHTSNDIGELLNWTADELGISISRQRNTSVTTRSSDESVSKQSLDRDRMNTSSPLRIGSKFQIEEPHTRRKGATK